MEWSNKYNSFNSYKGLTYYENYKSILKWLDGDPYLPPPIECNLDPIAECNLECYFCVTQRYLRHNRDDVGEMRTLPIDYLQQLVRFLSDWGVRGLCISGGGEPSLHKDIYRILSPASLGTMKSAFVTNATNLTPQLAISLMGCQWVALSVDSADRETYKKVKGVDKFDVVIKNISLLAKLRQKNHSTVSLCFKFLVLPENQGTIYEACKLAKNLGVQDFHVRPVDFERNDIKGHRKLDFNYQLIEEEFARCRAEETDRFRVYTVTHKFDAGLHVKHEFTWCLATPLVIPILTDGNAYLCVDRKMESKFRLGSCFPDPSNILKWWGSDAHRNLVKGVNPKMCSRCTWSQYNAQISEVVLQDNMCLSFP